MVDVELKKRGVYLGKTGETGRYRVWLDVSAWDEEYEGGVGLLLYTDPKGNTAPMRTVKEFDGEKTKLYGYVTAEETKEAGTGVIEVRWENAGVVAKSDHFNTVVMASSYTGKNIGENTPDWVRDLMTELNAVNVVLDEAAQVAEDVAAIRETIEGAETVAKAAALDAEAWAVGERDGEDVDEDDPTYGNNARKYAQDAGGSATFAQIERQTAEAWAVGKRNGQDVGSTDPAYHNNAKYYSEQAFSGTPEGYAALVEDVGDLKSAINVLEDAFSRDEFVLNTTTYNIFIFAVEAGKVYKIKNDGDYSVNVVSRDDNGVIETLYNELKAGQTIYVKPTLNAPMINFHGDNVHTGARITVTSGDFVDEPELMSSAFDIMSFPVKIDDDSTVMVDFSQGMHTDPNTKIRVMSKHITLSPGDTIYVGDLEGFQNKIFVFINTTTVIPAAETEWGTTSTYTNNTASKKYARIDVKRTTNSLLRPSDCIGLEIAITSTKTIRDATAIAFANRVMITNGSGILRKEFDTNGNTSAAHEFTFTIGKHYVFTNEYNNSTTLTTRLTADGARIETIGTLAPGDTVVFTPEYDAGFLFVYCTGKQTNISVLYGDGVEVVYDTATMKESVSGLESAYEDIANRIAVKQNQVVDDHVTYEKKEYSNGSPIDSDKKLLSNFIPVNGNTTVKVVCDPNTQARIIRLALDKAVADQTVYGTTAQMIVSVPSFVRVEVKRNDDGDIETTDADSVVIYQDGYIVDVKAGHFVREKSKYNLFNPRKAMVNGKTFDSTGAFVVNNYWAIAPLIDIKEYRGHTISCNKWETVGTRYAVFYADDGTVIPALIDGNPITIPSTASYAAIPLNKKDGNIKNLEDCVIWIDDLTDPVAEYNPLSASLPLRTFYTVPPHAKGCLEDGSPFRLDSQTKLQDVYDFYDRLKATFNTVMTREQIATSSTPTGDYAIEDPNTYPLYAYHIYPSVASRDTNNVIVVCSCIHGDSYPNGLTVPCDVFEHVAALGYVIEDLLFNPENNDITKFIREQCHLVVIPVVNPWGCQNGHRWNGRGIDLNRQFPDGFVPNSVEYQCSSGPEALSENESSGIYDFLTALHAAHPIKFFIDFQSRGGSSGVGSNDNRYLPIFKSGTYAQQRIMKRVGDTMVRRFGGVYDPQGWDAKGQLSVWVYDTMNIMSFTCETFGAPYERRTDRGHKYYLKNSIAYYGETLDVFTRHCIMGWNTYK